MAPVKHLVRSALVVCAACAFSIAPAQTAIGQGVTAPSPLDRWQPLIAEASRRFDVPEAWIRAVMRAESDGHTMLDGQPITSPAGAMGLMQVMPDTYDELRRQYSLGDDPYNPHDNIMAGAAYLRQLYARYGYPNLFAAYNAGPARLDSHLFNGQPLPNETLAYLAALGLPSLEPQHPSLLSSGGGLFFPLRMSADATLNSSIAVSSSGLFVSLTTSQALNP